MESINEQQYPRGKLNEHDEGELIFKVGHDLLGNVVVDFGKAVHWFAMPPEIARQLAQHIIDHAKEAEHASLSKA